MEKLLSQLSFIMVTAWTLIGFVGAPGWAASGSCQSKQEGKLDCMEFTGTLPAGLKQVCTLAGGAQWVDGPCPQQNVLAYCEVPRRDSIRQRVYCYPMARIPDTQSIEFCRIGCNGTFNIIQGKTSTSPPSAVAPSVPAAKPLANTGTPAAASPQLPGILPTSVVSARRLEADTFGIIRCTSGEAVVSTLASDGYAEKGAFTGDRSFHWHDAGQPGAFLELALPPMTKGRYTISVQAARYRTYGIHQFLINGVPVGKPVDMFGNPGHDIVTPFTVNLGEVELIDGPNRLTIRLVGTNSSTIMANHGAGLDWISLTPAETATKPK